MNLKEQLEKLQVAWQNLQKLPRIKLYNAAVASLGYDASPKDQAPDDLACAETVSLLISKVTLFPTILGTYTLYTRLLNDKRFIQTRDPKPGDIIISPTGMGNGRLVGHVGVIGVGGVIMSNSSYTGKFEKNYTLQTWYNRYGKLGGFPIYYFRLV